MAVAATYSQLGQIAQQPDIANLADSDIQFQINSIWSALAGA